MDVFISELLLVFQSKKHIFRSLSDNKIESTFGTLSPIGLLNPWDDIISIIVERHYRLKLDNKLY